MITKLKLVAAFLCLPFLGSTQSIQQFFDGNDTMPDYSILYAIDTANPLNIWQVGPPQKTIFNSSSTLPNVMVTDTINLYPINNQSAFTIYLNNLQFPWTDGISALQWMQKLDMEAGKDGGMVEYSLDSGATWHNAFNNPYVYSFYGFNTSDTGSISANGGYGFTGVDTVWRNIWLCFDNNYLSTQTNRLDVRFTFVSDSMDTQQEGWMIDNLYANYTVVHTVKKTESEEQAYLKVYPTRTTGRVNIEAEKLQDFHIIEQIDLISADGRIVQSWGTSPTKFFIDINQHANGLYYLRVQTNKKTETIKLVLNK